METVQTSALEIPFFQKDTPGLRGHNLRGPPFVCRFLFIDAILRLSVQVQTICSLTWSLCLRVRISSNKHKQFVQHVSQILFLEHLIKLDLFVDAVSMWKIGQSEVCALPLGRKIYDGVIGGPSGVSRVCRHGSEDPHQRQQKSTGIFYLKILFVWRWKH